MRREARDREANDENLGQLEVARHDRFVEAVGELAAQPRQDEKRRNEDRERERVQRGRALATNMEDDEEPQRVLEEIVVERREELAPEQGRKAPGRHEMY